MAAFVAPTSIDTLTGTFPPVCKGIAGELTLKDLIRIIYENIIPCAQSHVSTVYALIYLHLCIPAVMWAQLFERAVSGGPSES